MDCFLQQQKKSHILLLFFFFVFKQNFSVIQAPMAAWLRKPDKFGHECATDLQDCHRGGRPLVALDKIHSSKSALAFARLHIAS